MCSNELFRYINIAYTYPVRGYKPSGARYNIAMPLESVVWFSGVFLFIAWLVYRLYQIERNRDVLIMSVCFMLLWMEQMLSFNKPYGYIWMPEWMPFPYIPVSADMFVALVFAYLVSKDIIKNPEA